MLLNICASPRFTLSPLVCVCVRPIALLGANNRQEHMLLVAHKWPGETLPTEAWRCSVMAAKGPDVPGSCPYARSLRKRAASRGVDKIHRVDAMGLYQRLCPRRAGASLSLRAPARGAGRWLSRHSLQWPPLSSWTLIPSAVGRPAPPFFAVGTGDPQWGAAISRETGSIAVSTRWRAARFVRGSALGTGRQTSFATERLSHHPPHLRPWPQQRYPPRPRFAIRAAGSARCACVARRRDDGLSLCTPASLRLQAGSLSPRPG